MARRDITIEYEFTSTRAYGDSYTRRAYIKAHDERDALAVAHIVGFQWFGARFTDNCFDWRVVKT